MATSDGDPAQEPGQVATPPPRPTWVRVVGIVLALLVLVGIVMALSGGGHGPGQHLPGGDDDPGHGAPAQHDS